MFLNYRRSAFRYILLWIFTLGIYHIIFRRQILKDTRKACGEKFVPKYGVIQILLDIVTLGIYGVIKDITLIRIWQTYLNTRNVYFSIKEKKYLYLAIVPFVRVFAIPMYIKTLNLVCKAYSDSMLDEEDDDYVVPLAKIRREAEARKKAEEESLSGGTPIVEEYNFEDDQKRWAFREEEKQIEEVPAEVEEEPETVEEPEPDPELNYRNKKWFRKVFPAMLAVFLLPVILVIVSTFILPAVYEDTFIGELGEKYDRLESINRPKIVVIGGSSVAFGLDSEFIEEEIGMPVVNFGLYANLGTKLMMDLSKANINEGDIIILAPEMNEQTLSLYFNAETAIQAMDGNWKMLLHVDPDDYEAMIGATWKFSCDKLNYIFTGKRPTNEGAYKKENFNEYGDIVYDRPYNEMSGIPNVITFDFRTNYNDTIYSEYEEYVDYVNDYVAYAEKKGAKVYFSFAPMNAAAVSDKTTESTIYNFYKNLAESVNCKIISNINDYIMDEGYFYDSEFHLNNAGVVVRTVKLIDDLKRVMGRTDVTIPARDLPAPPGYKPIDVDDEDEENLYLELEFVDGASGKYWAVVGLNDAGKAQTKIEIPGVIDGYPIRLIRESAFAGSTSLSELTLGKYIDGIDPRAFAGSSIKKLIVPDGKKPDDISVPNSMGVLMTEDCDPELEIYVDAEYFESFGADYFWGDYISMLRSK